MGNMFLNLLSIRHFLRFESKNLLSNFMQVGFQRPERIFYEGPHGTVTYQELQQLVFATKFPTSEFFAPVQSDHPAYFFAEFLATLQAARCPVLLSHKDGEIHAFGPPSDIHFAGPLMAVLTSGSTGMPKTVVHSLEGLLWNILGVLESWQKELNWDDDFVPTFGLVLPWHHFGGFTVLLRAFVLNAKVIHTTKAEDFALQTPVDVASVVPTQVRDMIQALGSRPACTSHFLVGGAASEHLNELKGLSLSLSYGLTETGGTVAATSFGIPGPALPYPYRKLRAHDNNEFAISGPTVALGYFQNKLWHAFPEEQNGRVLIPPDLGTINPADGSLKILGRRDQIIICGGENIAPEEILRALSPQLRKSTEFLIVGLPDERLGHIAVLFFRPLDQTLNSKRRQNIVDELQVLPSFKRPRKILPLPPQSKWKGIKPSYQELVRWTATYEELHFEEWGNPTGPKILALHGFMGAPQDFLSLASNFPSFHWIVPYLPGHGTAIAGFQDFHQGCDKISDWWQQLYPSTPFSILGYSMGGRIGLGLVQSMLKNNSIQGLKNLLLISAGLGVDDEIKRRERRHKDESLPLNFETLESKRSYLNEWYRLPMWGKLNTQKFYPSLLEKRLALKHDEWHQAICRFGQGTHGNFKKNLAALVQQHECKIIYCYGELDFTYKKWAEEYQSLGIASYEGRGHGHALLEEGCEFLSDVIRKF